MSTPRTGFEVITYEECRPGGTVLGTHPTLEAAKKAADRRIKDGNRAHTPVRLRVNGATVRDLATDRTIRRSAEGGWW